MKILISETTKEEREQIVKESLGYTDASCEDYMARLSDMYQDYIDGKKELKQINMEYKSRYFKYDDTDEKESSCTMKDWE